MRYTTKAEYGLRALVNLAQRQDYFSLAQIAKEEKISLAYLERLFAKLKKAKIVQSVKGVKGGYKLSQPAGKISIKEVFLALEGSLAPYSCVEITGMCKNQGCGCKTKVVWQKLNQGINDTLEKIKLGDLI